MPRRKKRAHELTDEEAMKRLFPKKVRTSSKKLPTKPVKMRNPSLISEV